MAYLLLVGYLKQNNTIWCKNIYLLVNFFLKMIFPATDSTI